MQVGSPHPLGGRFVLEELAGSGGMGTVHRARDLHTGRTVAVKVLSDSAASDHQRFVQEAHALLELAHPSIVSYVAHGIDEGKRFLAMEWLEGEDLADRIARRGFTIQEVVALGRSAAAGLAAAHARGIIHRDIKPSNLLLVDGDAARTKVIDFGVARIGNRSPITRSGVVLGTAGYMAPEQARAAHDVDARADVFALGCVLFECLTGRPAFAGDHVLAVLAKVMLETVPRASALRANLPAALDDLVARMLAKDPAARPRDGREVHEALDAISIASVTAEAPRRNDSLTPRSLTATEQRFLSLAVIDFDVLSATTHTITPEQAVTDVERVREIAARFDASVTSLGEGTMVLSLAVHGGATAQSAHAATAALRLKEAFPAARIALATGRAATGGGGLPVGSVIDRATALIVTAASQDKTHVRIDDVTASLLGPHFHVKREGDIFVLLDAETSGDVVRPLLGRLTPCVGREKELALLQATLLESAAEPVARAVLLTAPAGMGKSRLRQELVARARGNELLVLSARAEPVGAGSALGIVRQIVRRAAELREGEPPHAQYERLHARLAACLSGEARLHTAEFLGELVGAPSVAPSPQLRVARNDPRILSERMRRAFLDWIAAECASRQVLIAVEDLHWGDLPSVSYLGDALRELADRPLMVLGTGRDEVHDLFPKLWSAEGMQEIRLGGLTRSACEKLVRSVLGGDVPPATLKRVVERADGNAFYLEELIRRVAERQEDDLPETVLAMVEARLSALESDARRLLRAASVFGEQFWEGGVVSLLGQEATKGDVAAWLRLLVDRELLVPGRGNKFPGEVEYVFRHGLLRDAAYAMLTDSDRQAGHALAGAWLESVGEIDSLVLAEHYERGEDLARAVPWITRAAIAARDGGNLEEAMRLVERGLAKNPRGEALGLLRVLEGECWAYKIEWARCLACEREAAELLPRHSPYWFLAVSAALYAGSILGDMTTLLNVFDADRDFSAAVPATGPFALGIATMILGLFQVGQRERALALLRGLQAMAARHPDADPSFAGWCHIAYALAEMYAFDDPGKAYASMVTSRTLFEGVGDRIGTAIATLLYTQALVEMGAYEEGLAASQDARAQAEKTGLTFVGGWSLFYGARALARTGRTAEAKVAASPLLLESGDPYRRLLARSLVAEIALRDGDLDTAEAETHAVLDLKAPLPPRAVACACEVLGRVLATRGDAKQALEYVEKGLACQAESGLSFVTSALLATKIRALTMLGRHDESEATRAVHHARLARLAANMTPAHASTFLAVEGGETQDGDP